MTQPIDWLAKRVQYSAHIETELFIAAQKDSASADFFSAAIYAKRLIQQEELFPALDSGGEPRYSVRQGVEAACFAREDAAAILAIQQSVLRRLQGIRVLLWSSLAVLGYIALRVS